MHIITIPHQSLRSTATPIEKLDKKTIKYLDKLGQTLQNKRNPRGVGLAFPQVDKLLRAFVTYLEPDEKSAPQITSFINPRILSHSPKHTLGPKPKEPVLEGCLSMPKLYGPVPRWEWIELEYQLIDQSGDSAQLVTLKQKYDGFHARVIQHEIDHLDGVLFTDYALEYNLPVYIEEGRELVEIDDRDFLESY